LDYTIFRYNDEWKNNNKNLTAWFEKFVKNQFMKSTVPV
jgi:hypothetical protein